MTIEQGDIVLLNFDPTLGHEQWGSRPALVVSRTLYNEKTGFIVVCPITTKSKPFPMRVPLNEKTKTKGFVICEQVRTIDVTARKPRVLEKAADETLSFVLEIVSAIF